MSEVLLIAIFAGATEGTTSAVLEHRRRHLPLAGNVPIPTNRDGILLAQLDRGQLLTRWLRRPRPSRSPLDPAAVHLDGVAR
jgi:hypothetical protein